MQCWKEGLATTQMQRELQCGCSARRKDQQQHGCRDVAVQMQQWQWQNHGCIGGSSAGDGGQEGLASAQVSMSNDQSNTQ